MNECSIFPVNLKFALNIIRASLVAQRLKCLPAMRETWVRFLGRKDPLEKEMATHSSILVWRIPWTEEPGGLQSMGSQRVDTAERLHFTQYHAFSFIHKHPPTPHTYTQRFIYHFIYNNYIIRLMK